VTLDTIRRGGESALSPGCSCTTPAQNLAACPATAARPARVLLRQPGAGGWTRPKSLATKGSGCHVTPSRMVRPTKSCEAAHQYEDPAVWPSLPVAAVEWRRYVRCCISGGDCRRAAMTSLTPRRWYRAPSCPSTACCARRAGARCDAGDRSRAHRDH